jgi:hypothetical protein
MWPVDSGKAKAKRRDICGQWIRGKQKQDGEIFAVSGFRESKSKMERYLSMSSDEEEDSQNQSWVKV